MLHSLYIKNFATIDSLEIDFHTELSAITGDSGAGKSIILSALNLVLGARADKSFLKASGETTHISASFHTTDTRSLQFLADNDVENSDAKNIFILRRTISNTASKSYINDIPVSLNLVQQLAECIIDISTQNSHQLLLKNSHQLTIVDDYAGNYALLTQIQRCATEINALQRAIDDSINTTTNNKQQLDFLEFQLQELIDANLDVAELETIEEHYKIVHNSQYLIQDLSNAYELLTSNTVDNSLELIAKSATIDAKLKNAYDMLESAKINIDEASAEINNYLQTYEQDPEEVVIITTRLSTLNDLARKHNCQITELVDKQYEFEEQISTIATSSDNISAMQQEIVEKTKEYQKLSEKLTTSRTEAATKISTFITDTISQLGMPGAEFSTQITAKKGIFNNGNEQIDFLIKTNVGSEFKSLKKTASGGELSRISLAVSLAVATSGGNTNTPIFVFDEVDVGISGAAASVVGAKLRELSATSQVICITHLPQVASCAHQHLLVNKTVAHNTTTTTVSYLDAQERIHEIARILSGDNVSDNTLALATEMLTSNAS